MEEKLDQLQKNNIWVLVPRRKIEPGHCLLRKKCVYKVKRDVDDNVVQFKAK